MTNEEQIKQEAQDKAEDYMESFKNGDKQIVAFTQIYEYAYIAGATRDGWMPIETAPKDGTLIDVWLGNAEFPRRETDVNFREPSESEYWVNGSDEPDPNEGQFTAEPGWFCNCLGTFKLQGSDSPTHWQPIPSFPNQ